MTKCFFSNLQKITIAELRNAKKSVCIAVAWINFDIYFPVFAELLSQGICVQIIINDDANNARYRNQIENLILQGVKITLINAIGIMHHKFCVIDENQCIFGSYNWTINAETKNIEDLNICDEPQLIYNYLEEFVALKELSKTDLRLLRNPAKCKDCGVQIVNILIVEQEGYYQSRIQMLEMCGCGYYWHSPEYYDISVYNNYMGIIEKYEYELECCEQYGDQGYIEEIRAKQDFELAMYWARVRRNRFGFVIIHAVGMPGARMYGRHEEELFYQIIWKERGMEQYIPDEIPRDA